MHKPASLVSPILAMRRLWLAWASACALLTLWDLSGADLRLMQGVGNAAGFAWQNHPCLTSLLHDGLRRLFAVAYGLLCVWAVWPIQPGGVSRRERLVVAVGVFLSLLLVSGLKRISLTSCPWDLQAFGGQAIYVSHWRWGLADGGPGHCFPGGHASGGLAFMLLALPWWRPVPGAQRDARIGHLWLALALLAGWVAGTAQTLRGAHFPSHTGWSALLCGFTALMVWTLCLPWMANGRSRRPPSGALIRSPAQADVQR
jgi:membrane-associated PAP2 superfamily phosphatase